MNRILPVVAGTLSLSILAGLLACDTEPVRLAVAPATPSSPEQRPDVMESAFCKSCHPDIYAEHEQNTHGRAFTDEEVRLATARFAHQDCIICHTPRPIFESGVGMNPIRRFYDVVEGNSCMTCHWKPGYDYSRFAGGAECKGAFHPDVGTVEACASCHRNHGTPYQWEKNPNGKASGRVCIDCHMPEVERPVAVGGPVKRVRSHVFPASRSDSQKRRAYAYDVVLDGSAVVVTIKNKGAGHNFPTELKQRSVESLVIVRDLEGAEVARSRMVFRDPYKRPYGLELPVNTQIPGGQTREHRVPIPAAAGTVECTLFYKLYYPIEDFHPELSYLLESRKIPFAGLTPSTEPVVTDPEVKAVSPEGIAPELASPANLVDYAHPAIAKVAVDIPAGGSAKDILHLIELFQFPVPEANGKARTRLAEIGAPAVPALVDAMGSWDNKTWNQAMQVLETIGEPARPAVARALDDERLYVRIHARELAARNEWAGTEVEAAIARGLASAVQLDRASAATAAGDLELVSQASALERLLADADPDVVRAAAMALAKTDRRGAISAIRAAMLRARFPETRRDLAAALAQLGSAEGIPILLEGLDHEDDVVRESFFEALFAATGVHLGYEPLAPRPERLESLAQLQAWWAKQGGPACLLPHGAKVDKKADARATKLVGDIGGSDLAASTPERDREMEEELIAYGEASVSALVRGLKFPPGFADKRAAICRILGRIGDRRAAPALASALRDPVMAVSAWAAWALERVQDPATIRALRRYEQRVLSRAASGGIPETVGPVERVIAQSARARLILGDDSARNELAGCLLSDDRYTRQMSIEALQKRFGEDRGFDPDGEPAERRAAAGRWAK